MVENSFTFIFYHVNDKISFKTQAKHLYFIICKLFYPKKVKNKEKKWKRR